MRVPYSMVETAALSGCSVPTLYRRLHRGEGPRTIRQGKLRLVLPDDLDAWLNTLRVAA